MTGSTVTADAVAVDKISKSANMRALVISPLRIMNFVSYVGNAHLVGEGREPLLSDAVTRSRRRAQAARRPLIIHSAFLTLEIHHGGEANARAAVAAKLYTAL